MPDPLGTADIRAAVLSAWTAMPERLREDANTEEDFVAGAYRDRVLVELAQNAADAAAQGAVPGIVSFTLRPGELIVANTGAPLTRDGVRSLASIRASAKRDVGRAVGRFGVGFSAVLELTDEPSIASTGGGVGFSAQRTAQAISATDEASLLTEVARRDGHVPILRLPFPADIVVPQPFSTVVRLPLRPGADDLAAELLDALVADPDPLLLALPALVEIWVSRPGRERFVARDVLSRWRVRRTSGRLSQPALAALPTEARWHAAVDIVWARREPDSGAALPGVLYAPTPTDEPNSLPALLIAQVPLEPGRRHVHPGPAGADVAELAGAAYADLVADIAREGTDIAPMLPVGLAAGPFDAMVREAASAALRSRAILPGADGSLVAPDAATVIETEAPLGSDEWTLLARHVSGLVLPGPAARAMQVPVVSLADVLDQLPSPAEPARWATDLAPLLQLTRHAALAEAFGSFAVPRADGRIARGVRGLLVGDIPGVSPPALAALAPFGLPLAHPDAVEDAETQRCLIRLGAIGATASDVVDSGATRDAVRWAYQAAEELLDNPSGEPGEDDESRILTVSGVVVDLVSAAWEEGAWPPGERAWLRDLVLPDEHGDLAPASALVLPETIAAQVVRDAVALHPEWRPRASAAVWQAIGVAAEPVLEWLRDVDPLAPDDDVLDLDGAEDWLAGLTYAVDETTGEPVSPFDAAIIRDLETIDPAQFPGYLAALARDPDGFAALTGTHRLAGPRGVAEVMPYPAWWLKREIGVAGTYLATTADPVLASLLPPAPAWLAGVDPRIQTTLGVVTGWSDLDDATLATLLHRLADAPQPPPVATLLRLWQSIAESGRGVAQPPSTLWALDQRLRPVRVTRRDAVVVDQPQWSQLEAAWPAVLAPPGRGLALATALDLDEVADRCPEVVTSLGEPAPMPQVVAALIGAAPKNWIEHEDLLVDGRPVDWWIDEAGALHASTLAGLADAVCWATGHWQRRHVVAEALSAPAQVAAALVEVWWE